MVPHVRIRFRPGPLIEFGRPVDAGVGLPPHADLDERPADVVGDEGVQHRDGASDDLLGAKDAVRGLVEPDRRGQQERRRERGKRVPQEAGSRDPGREEPVERVREAQKTVWRHGAFQHACRDGIRDAEGGCGVVRPRGRQRALGARHRLRRHREKQQEIRSGEGRRRRGRVGDVAASHRRPGSGAAHRPGSAGPMSRRVPAAE
ncbi:hypothetical protein DFJ74DRAFT_686401 [Hyaloraphidium curvatum]|nr:hypothetical protein DFJ74DRAFT_686401 [Hyaloraphidium curvatum]